VEVPGENDNQPCDAARPSWYIGNGPEPLEPGAPLAHTILSFTKMQALANAAQSYMGPAPGSVVENEYKPDPSGKKMKALTWQGADNVKLMECDVPAITQDKDVILKVSCAWLFGPSSWLISSVYRSPVPRSVVPTFICTTARSLPCKRTTFSVTSRFIPFIRA
jgi:hypothetical protein